MTPHHADDRLTLYAGDCLDVLRGLPDASVDAVVTDPPYGLGFMGKAWDNPDQGAATRPRADGDHTANPFKRSRAEYGGASYGGDHRTEMHSFQQWCELWTAECLRVLKPGGHLLAFGGTRTWHRLACAVEDAGFEVRDSIAWLYGSGFPKSLDVSKAITAHQITGGSSRRQNRMAMTGDDSRSESFGSGPQGSTTTATVKAPPRANLTPDGEQWQGWGTALKPAHEPVLCARKPFNAVPLGSEANRLHHLIGALLWLSLSPAKRASLTSTSSPAGPPEGWCASALASAATSTSLGGSVATDTYNSPALASTLSSIVSSWKSILVALSAPTSTSTTSTRSSTTTDLRILSSLLAPLTSQTTMPRCGCLLGGSPWNAPNADIASTDEWARWLHTLSASVPETAIEGIALVAASALAQAAASLSDDLAAASSAAPTATTGADASSSPAFELIVVARKPLVGTVAANVLAHGTGALNIGACRIDMGDEYDPTKVQRQKASSGIYVGGAKPGDVIATYKPGGRWPANVILDEDQADALDQREGYTTGQYDDLGGASRFFYTAKAASSERPNVNGIAHPTVKPLDLMRWLVRLVTPPGGTVLEPFAGSGTTVEACILEGFRCIAIEREADYLPLIVGRIQRRLDPVAAVKAQGGDAGLFDLLDELDGGAA